MPEENGNQVVADNLLRGKLTSIIENSLRDNILPLFNANDFSALHFYWGNHQEWGSIRLTGLNIPDNSPLSTEAAFVALDKDKHKAAFAKHIAQFGSRNTLLRWLYQSALNKLYLATQLQEDIKPIKTEQQRYFRARFELCNEEDSPLIKYLKDEEGYDLLIQYNPTLLNALWSYRLTSPYRNKLYFENITNYERVRFLLFQGDALGKFHANEQGHGFIDCLFTNCSCLNTIVELGHVLEEEGTNITADQSAQYFLTALQAGLVYLSVVRSGHSANVSSFDFYAFLDKQEQLDSLPPVLSIFTLDNDPINDDKSNLILSNLKGCLNDILKEVLLNEKDIPTADHYLSDKAKKQIFKGKRRLTRANPIYDWEAAMKHMDVIFPFHELRIWHTCLIYWLCSLICELRGSIHEGASLGFRFVCGDFSEIENNNNVSLEKIDAESMKALTIPFPEETALKLDAHTSIQKRFQESCMEMLKKAAENIAKQNYSWFKDSRYALFWDLTFPNPAPVGLLKLQHGDWDWYIRENSERGQRISELPALVMGYALHTGRGGLLIGNRKMMGLSDQLERKKVLAYWIEQQLKEHTDFYAGRDNVESDDIVLLIGLLSQIADDPDSGCCIVFLKDNVDPDQRFIKMGREWKLTKPVSITKKHRDILFHLLPTDGAACVSNCGGELKINFKYLLQIDSSAQVFLDLLSAINIGNCNCVLRGCGSRRWSGAMAVLHDDVRLVIVVSQDGDMHAFRKNSNGLIEQAVSPLNGKKDYKFKAIHD